MSCTLCRPTIGTDSMGHGGHSPSPPTVTNGWTREGTVSRTANKKLTKLNGPSRKSSPKRLIILLEPKKCRSTTKKTPLSNSFRRHWGLQGGPKK